MRFIQFQMGIIRCIGTYNSWEVGFLCVSVIYVATFVYAIIPPFRHRKEFSSLPKLNRASRIGFTLSLFVKGVFNFCAYGISKKKIKEGIEKSKNLFSLCGLLLLELPCYIINTSYTLVLLFWLTVCHQILPYHYMKTFKRMKVLLIIYNILFYLLFFSDVMLEIFVRGDKIHKSMVYSGAIGILRDFILCLIFIIFVICLKVGLKEDQFAEETRDEKKLYLWTTILSFFLLVRGILNLVQGTKYNGKNSDDCAVGIFVIYLINDILLEEIPLLLLIYSNNEYLNKQSVEMQYDPNNMVLVSSLTSN